MNVTKIEGKQEFVSPNELFDIDRLDIVIKYLYINAFITNNNIEYYKEIYKKHIYRRTFGFEGSKRKIDDYLFEFDKLINSVKTKGYLGEPIPISNINTGIIDGAHRLACCLYFNIDIPVKYVNKKALSWNIDWFIDNYFSYEELKLILDNFGCINKLYNNEKRLNLDYYYIKISDIERSNVFYYKIRLYIKKILFLFLFHYLKIKRRLKSYENQRYKNCKKNNK